MRFPLLEFSFVSFRVPTGVRGFRVSVSVFFVRGVLNQDHSLFFEPVGHSNENIRSARASVTYEDDPAGFIHSMSKPDLAAAGRDLDLR